MIIKVNDVRGLGQPQATGLNGGSSAAPLQQPAGGKAEPAAVIGLSEAAKVAQALPMSANADKLDLDLVQEIRQRIAEGTFEIDYQKVAGNLLGNAVAAVRAGRG
jgi:negative regulator of flagellin synthesis FlgM